MSIMFASIGEPNAIKKSGTPNNFFSKCAIKRGIHLQCPKLYMLYNRPGQKNMVKSRVHSKIDSIIPEN
jgi:hypothetical protein